MSASINIPLDSDGYIRRECPTCEQEFKWHADDDASTEIVHQYYCPLCGQPSGPDNWHTKAQVELARVAIMPDVHRHIDDMLEDAFRGSKSVTFKRSNSPSSDDPMPDPLHEPDDMVMIASPCHPEEPVKVPEDAEPRFYCLLCGEPYAA